MQLASGPSRILIAILAIGLWAGCRNGSDSNQPDTGNTPPTDQAASPDATTGNVAAETEVAPRVVEPPPPLTIPEVLLTDELRNTCVVHVDALFPKGELPNAAGEVQSLGQHYGEKLTVVFFWTTGTARYSKLAARAALEDMQKDVFEAYREKGLSVVSVNQGDTAEAADALLDEAGATFPRLLDTDGTFFAKVATKRLPRPYLLDAEGKILWFDVGFDQTTRDALLQAIQVALGEI